MEPDPKANDTSEETGNGANGDKAPKPSTIDELTQRLEAVSTEMDALRADVATLKQADDDIQKKLEAYEKPAGLPQIRQQLKDASKTGKEARQAVECVFTDPQKKMEVDSAWDKVQTAIDEAKKMVGTTKDALVTAQKSVLEKERTSDAAKEELATVSDRQAAIATSIQKLTKLKGDIDTALTDDKPVEAYVRLREYERELRWLKDNVEDVDAFRAALEAARDKLSTAQGDVRDATVKRASAKAGHDAAKAESERLGKNRIAEVLKKLRAPASAGA